MTHADLVERRDGPRAATRALADASRDRRLARHPRAGHDRRQRDERLAGDGHRRAAAVLRRDGDRSGRASGERSVALDDLWTGPGTTVGRAGRAADVASTSRAPAAGTGSCYVRLEYRRQMEIAVVGATAVVTLDGGDGHATRGSRSRRSPRRSAASPRPSRRSPARDGGADAIVASAAAAAAAATADQRRPRVRRATAARWPRSSPARDPRGAGASARRGRPDPREPGALRVDLRSHDEGRRDAHASTAPPTRSSSTRT